MITIKTNIAKIINTELKDLRNDINKATRSATTKVARQASTAAKDIVKETYSLPAAELNKATKIKPATTNNSSAAIQVSGKYLSLDKFKALRDIVLKKKNQKRDAIKMGLGATAMIVKGRRVVIPGSKDAGTKSFYAVMKSGHKGIFYRVGKNRLKIVERVGPSAPDLMRSRKAYNAIKDYVKINYERIYNSEYNYFKKK